VLAALSTLAAVTTACLSAGKSLGPLPLLPAGGIHVMLIGHSLTYPNPLPGTLSALAMSVGDTVRVQSVAGPDLAAIDHVLGATNAVAAVKQGKWRFVVLQQGPTSQKLYRDTLILATQQLDPLVKAAGGVTAQMMTWPNANSQSLFDAIKLTCQLAAQSVADGQCFPVGEAWRAAWALDPSLALYGSDGFHPSALGTYLAALVIYENVTSKDARLLPARAVVAGQTLSASEATVRLLQKAAHETVAAFR